MVDQCIGIPTPLLRPGTGDSVSLPDMRYWNGSLSQLVSCERGSFTWAAFREYLVGGLGPDEGVAAVIPAVDEGLDGGDEVGDRGEAAAADGLPGDDREEDLHEVQPRPRRRREVQGNPGVFRQPRPYVWMGVRAVVVA